MANPVNQLERHPEHLEFHFEPDELDVRVAPEEILIQSERVHQPPAEGETIFTCEFVRGKLFRDIPLPARIDPQQAKAEYWNGLLRVTAPIVQDAGPKRIELADQ